MKNLNLYTYQSQLEYIQKFENIYKSAKEKCNQLQEHLDGQNKLRKDLAQDMGH